MTDTKVYLLDFGTLVLDGYMMFWGRGPSGPFRFPCYGVLVEHKEGRFLFDTGYSKDWFDQNMPGLAQQTELQTVPGQLARIGLRPSDITHVVNSHMHVDHVGGNHLCTQACTLCHKKELESYKQPEIWEAHGYADRTALGTAAPDASPATPEPDDRVQDIVTPRFELLTGDNEIARGVHLFETPGHTPGHYSMMVELAGRRPMLFTGDACYTKRSLEENIIANAHTDVRDAHTSLQRLRDLAEQYDAELFYSHDPDAWRDWKPAPAHYS
ncbi:4-pyridoxolactonase [Hyphomonas johnsonii]|uniref:Zn-dependent hydrolase, glyoxylase n=1 Tax=Hyphomonas johnsonii MHS-2 TaxID=1280950 RepID=A0A059FUT8_9PROT|nr:N-acyl homoserine lactonase family protein [Hyphomonas johnsonii]KCZ94208.1 Zn-dependent hydrolase, glyoxylase [Hyphomonas johnsonii MHS-2]